MDLSPGGEGDRLIAPYKIRRQYELDYAQKQILHSSATDVENQSASGRSPAASRAVVRALERFRV